MGQTVVNRLEHEIAESIAGVISRLERRDLPLLPSRQTVHLMAKSAVAVYEAAVENQPKRCDE